MNARRDGRLSDDKAKVAELTFCAQHACCGGRNIDIKIVIVRQLVCLRYNY